MERFLNIINEIQNEDLRNIILEMYGSNMQMQSYEIDYLDKLLDLANAVIFSMNRWDQDDVSIFYAAIFALSNPEYKDEYELYSYYLLSPIKEATVKETFLRSILCFDNGLQHIGIDVTTFPANSLEYQVYNVHQLASSYFRKLL